MSAFDDKKREGDNIVYDESLGCRVNLSQLNRVSIPNDPIEAYNKAISDAAEWLEENSPNYVYWMDEEFGKEDLINDFKTALEKGK